MDIYSTADLLDVIRVQQGITPYWLNLFPRVVRSDREEILFDQVTDGTKELAPFVAPNVQGRVLRERGYSTKTFRPAYVKPKHVVDPSRAIPRMAGEAIGGELSAQQRYDAIVAENMRIERIQIENRWEWMAARAVIDGEVTVVGEDYPSVTVNFGRDSSLTGVLLSTARWGQSDADPLGDIEDYRRKVHKLTGTTITRLTFGLDAWALFTANQEVRELLNSSYRGSDTEFNRAVSEGTPYEYRGILSGQRGMGRLELYTYAENFVDENGDSQEILNSLDVVGTGAGLQGVRCFGAIKDKRSGLRALEMFPKMWDVEDPSVTYTMTQSAPLMVPAQPNASFKLTVAS